MAQAKAKGWRMVRWGAEGRLWLLEITPKGDMRRHASGHDAQSCWCEPSRERFHGIIIVCHQAADGRVLIERHGLQ